MKMTNTKRVLAIWALLMSQAAVRPAASQAMSSGDTVKTKDGLIRGVAQSSSGVRIFRGIPFAAPPVGGLRWKAPVAPKPWNGVRQATEFSARCMQPPISSDMVSRSNGISEDCLYLNVWTPAKSEEEKLPVLVYIYGGGFFGGDASEARYDGENIATQGVVVVTMNYRLGVFGFLSHPDLSQEAAYHGSGDYGLLDQSAAIKWVSQNISAFGGDPQHITIGGESAGSISVSGQMASPLSKNLLAGAIGESGSLIGSLSAIPLTTGEQNGVKFAQALGATSIDQLRAMSAYQIYDGARKSGVRFSVTVDGYFFPKSPAAIYEAGEQAHIPLLAGSNSEESGAYSVLGHHEPTLENYKRALQQLYGDKANEVFALYPASADGTSVLDAAQSLASDRFIAFSTGEWMTLATKTGGKPTYYYFYSRKRPDLTPEVDAAFAYWQVYTDDGVKYPRPPARGASHSAEIEYALGNLDRNVVYRWTDEDRQLSKVINGYFVNFIKTGDPNGKGLPPWPTFKSGKRLIIDVDTHAETENIDARYAFLYSLLAR